ncbi:MAG TPA: 6-bladed beta-propeller [Longimicrobiales bacterium]
MQRHRLVSLSATAAAVLAGCGGAPGSGDWAGTERDSAGVVIVENPGTGVWRPGEQWSVVEELRIGVAEGDPDYQFGNVAGIDADSDGRIYVLDQQAQELRIFDAQGTLLRTVGRAGSGPGEFSPGAGPVVVGRGDTVLVPDILLQRVNRFVAGGEEAGSFPLPMAAGIPIAWAKTPDGRVAYQLMHFPLPGQPQPEGSTEAPIVARGMDGSSDTLAVLRAGTTFRMQGGAMQIRMFEPEPVWDIAADGTIITAVNTDYRIEVRRPDGTVVRVIRKPFERAPVTEADREAFMELFRDAWRRAGVPPAAMQQLEQGVSFAEYYPALARIKVGPGNTIWVQQIKTAAMAQETGAAFNLQDAGSPRWDVFDADGRYLGVVEFPASFALMTFNGDVVYGVLRDELEVQYVARFRVVRKGAMG